MIIVLRKAFYFCGACLIGSITIPKEGAMCSTSLCNSQITHVKEILDLDIHTHISCHIHITYPEVTDQAPLSYLDVFSAVTCLIFPQL